MKVVYEKTHQEVLPGTVLTDPVGQQWIYRGISCGPDDYTHVGPFPGRVFADGNGRTNAELFPQELGLQIVE